MKKIVVLLLLIAGWQTIQAQNVNQFFVRPDESKSDELFMQPDIEVNLDDKDAAWQFIVDKYRK